MTKAEIENIIANLKQKIPELQMQLHQAEGYLQALSDIEKQELDYKGKKVK